MKLASNIILTAGMFIVVTMCYSTAYSQEQPAAYSNTIKINYIRTWEAKGPVQDPTTLVGLPTTGVTQTTAYRDALGRPLQTVVKQGSPLGKDLVTANRYDDYG